MHIRDFSFFNRRRCESDKGFKVPVTESLALFIGALKRKVRALDNCDKDAVADVLGEAVEMLDLIASSHGLSLEDCVLEAWDKTSKLIHYSTSLRAVDKAFTEGEIRDKGGLN